MAPVALITGSSKGIGRKIAEGAAAARYEAVVTYKSDSVAGQATVDSIVAIGGNASLHQLDVCSESSVLQLFEEISSTHGRLDAVVSNAVTDVIKPIDEATLDEWHVPLLTKLDGAFLCTKYAIPLLEQSDNPSVTYITSIDGDRPDGSYLGYQVATAGVIAMTKANAVYLGNKYKIRVNAVAPGPVKTDLWGPDINNTAMWNKFNAKSPMGRVGDGSEVADACVYLASDKSRFLNGAILDVDGGSRWA